jgi:transcriptional regulator with XRE-family HTH domain
MQHEPHPSNVSLGQYLARARHKQGFSIRQLAQLSGVNRGAIARLEGDEVEQPSADTIVRLGRALELNEADLLMLAGIAVPTQAASLDVMLRQAYGLPPEGVERVKHTIEALLKEYNAAPDGDGTNAQEGGKP